MGLFSRKKSPKEEKIKELVGGFTYSDYLKQRMEELGLIPYNDYWVFIQDDFKKEVKDNNIPIEEIEELLDKLIIQRVENFKESEKIKAEESLLKKEDPDNEERLEELKNLKKLKEKEEKLSEDRKIKFKELVGGWVASENFKQLLEDNGLIPYSEYWIDIKKEFENEIKKNNVPVENMESVLNGIIINKKDNLSIKEKEEIEKEKVKRQEKEQKELLKFKEKAENKREKIRKGVSCKVPKNVHGPNDHSGLRKGAATLSFDLVGWAATSGTESELEKMLIPAVIKVVPKGVVIEAEHEEPIRLPFDKIVKVEGGYSLTVYVVGGQKVLVESCSDYNEVNYLINESACGIEEEG